MALSGQLLSVSPCFSNT
jgi:hypothetical protein